MKKCWKILMALCILVPIMPKTQIFAASSQKIDIKSEQVKAKGASGNPVSNVVDGNHNTYWQSMSKDGEGNSIGEQWESRMSDHNRYIDIELGGTYDLTEIKLFNNVDGSYSNYYVYASEDGTKYDKIISKTNTTPTTSDGDRFEVNKRAAYIRINMAFNSSNFVTNLADIEIYGSKASSTVKKPAEITTTSWADSQWKTEWDKFENDQKYANEKTLKEVQNLVGRVIGDEWKSYFKFELRSDLDSQDIFDISDGDNGTIIIRGNNGVSLASGFNYYLKNYAMVDYNPLFASNTELVNGIVPVNETIVKSTQYDLRYALNFCTYSYTMAFWNWTQFEAFLDWGAMNGVNLMLDIVGQEEVIRQLLKEYNYTDEEIKDYIAGPGYFAWFYMQNLYSYGGPLPDNWFEQRVELGRQMHDRMQAYGIQPVIQGFSGQVPLTFDDKNEGAVLAPLDSWPSFTRPAIVQPYLTDADKAAGKKNYFPEMAAKFYEIQENIFGKASHYYAADPFHEGGKTDGLQIGEIYKQVQTEMLSYDADAIWVMQQWQSNLTDPKLKGLIKPEQALALDLQSDLNQENGVMESNKVPWLWNMLHNFGGRMGLDGELEVTATKLPADYEKFNYMKGIGITPEALENSPVAYEMLFDMTWTNDPIDYQEWVAKYAERRAGGTSDTLQEAWKILTDTAYAKKGQYFQGAAETVINATPRTSFKAASTWGHSAILYDKKELEKALQLLIDNYDEFSNSPAYRYDLADVSEQVLCNAAIEYHSLMVSALNAGNSELFKEYSTKFLEIIDLSDRILSTNEEFMLGTWINDSRNMLEDADDWTKDLFEFNARALVTTWGGKRSDSLNDYSNRKWGGLTRDYYGKRWEMWVANKQADLDKTEKNPEYVAAENDWFMWGWRWVNLKSDDGFGYETTPLTSSLKQNSQKALDTYSVTELEKNGGSVTEKVNIALGKKFTTSSGNTEGTIDNVTDGTTENYWIANGAGPHVMTLDLEGVYAITDIAIAIKQAAGDYPMNYKVEYMNENGDWVEFAKQEGTAMQSNTVLSGDLTASQIRVTMATRDLGNFPVFIAEIEVFGTPKDVKTYINVAKGKTAVSTIQTDKLSNIAFITDDIIDPTNKLWKTIWSGTESAMYPCDVTIDLAGTAEADFIEVYLEKTGLPYKFTVGAVDENGNETIVLDKSDTTETLDTAYYKIPMNQNNITKVIVHFVGRTGKGTSGAANPALSEVKVLSTKEMVAYKNFALGKSTTATSTQAGRSTTNMTDGNKDTVWVFNGYDYNFWDGTQGAPITPILATVDLGNAVQIDQLKLYFTQNENKYYFFDVYVYPKGSSTRKKVYSAQPDTINSSNKNDNPCIIDVNEKITKVEVEFQGKVTGKDGWYDIAEIEAIGPEKQDDEIIFGKDPISGVTTNAKYADTIDGDLNNFVKDIKDAEIVYNLGGNYFVESANFTFEKAGLGLRYIVYAEDSSGNRSVVLDRSTTNSLLTDRTVIVNVKQTASKIIFKHLGNNGKGGSPKAETRLYEATFINGTPNNIAQGGTTEPQEANVIIDGDSATGYTASKNNQMIVNLSKPTDISMFNLKSDNSIAGKYTIDVFDLGKNEWKTVYDGSENTKLGADFYVSLATSMYTDKVRITVLNETLKILEFQVYDVDKTMPLRDYIEEIETSLSEKQYDSMNGSYTLEAKAIVEEKIAEANAALALGMNSVTVSQWVDTLKASMKKFMLNGPVFVSRNELLKELSQTSIVIKEINAMGNSVITATIQSAYDKAKISYDTYMITQASIDTACAELKTAKETFISSLSVVNQYKVQLALVEEELKNASVGTLDGQVTQEAIDALKVIVEKAKTDYASADETKIVEITNTLKNGLKDFIDKKVVVDRSKLSAIIQSVSDLRQMEYDITSWNEMQQALEDAKTVLDTALVSQQDVDTAQNTLETAISQMVKLDRTTLRAVLDEVSRLNETSYTSDSWNALLEVNAKAISVYNSDSNTQNDLDEAADNLKQAIENLVEYTKEPEKEDVTILNPSSGIYVTGKFEGNVELAVKDLISKEIDDVISNIKDKSFAARINIERLFDLSLMKDGSVYTHDGIVTVKIPIPEGLENEFLKVVFFAEDGSVEVLETRLEEGFLIFETNHFSKYGIISYKTAEVLPPEDNKTPPSNDSSSNDSSSNGSSSNGSSSNGSSSNNSSSKTPGTGVNASNSSMMLILLLLSGGVYGIAQIKRKKVNKDKNSI